MRCSVPNPLIPRAPAPGTMLARYACTDARRFRVLFGDSSMQTITAHQHLQATYCEVSEFRGGAGPRFAKQGEDQGKAVKRFMAARKRAWATPERQSFPRWTPGMSTREYVLAYCGNSALSFFQPLCDEPRQLVDDSVIVEFIEPTPIDAAACMDAALLAAADFSAQHVGA